MRKSNKIHIFPLVLVGIVIGLPMEASADLSSAVFLENKSVVSATEFIPEAFSSLPNEATDGIDEATYSKCIGWMSEYNVKFFRISYLSDGLRVSGLVGLPREFNPNRKYPVVIFNRGGNQEYGRITACGLRGLTYRYSNDGAYIVFASQYRGVAGGEGKEEFGGADVDDVMNLLDIARSYSFSDSKNIFMAGHSRGGMMTYLALKQGAKINAAIVLAGPTDLILVERDRPEMGNVFNELIPGIVENRKDRLKERSAVYWPEKLTAPMLILHGTADVRVSIQQSIDLDTELTKLSLPHRFVSFQNEGHSFSTAAPQVKAEIQDWIRSHLVLE